MAKLSKYSPEQDGRSDTHYYNLFMIYGWVCYDWFQFPKPVNFKRKIYCIIHQSEMFHICVEIYIFLLFQTNVSHPFKVFAGRNFKEF